MITTGYSLFGGDLLISSSVVSEITKKEYDDVLPPNKAITLKSGPILNITAECPYR